MFTEMRCIERSARCHGREACCRAGRSHATQVALIGNLHRLIDDDLWIVGQLPLVIDPAYWNSGCAQARNEGGHILSGNQGLDLCAHFMLVIAACWYRSKALVVN